MSEHFAPHARIVPLAAPCPLALTRAFPQITVSCGGGGAGSNGGEGDTACATLPVQSNSAPPELPMWVTLPGPRRLRLQTTTLRGFGLNDAFDRSVAALLHAGIVDAQVCEAWVRVCVCVCVCRGGGMCLGHVLVWPDQDLGPG